MQKDNVFARDKAYIRQQVRASFAEAPLVLETHGGLGVLYEYAYRDCLGTTIDLDETKCEHLAGQRPTWAVYCGDAASMLAAGVPVHHVVDLLDVDPWGDPWPTIMAFFRAERKWSQSMAVVVHDGLRNKARMRGAWSCETLAPIAQEWETEQVYAQYIEACKKLMVTAIADRYHLEAFRGFYSAGGNHTHYWATLRRLDG